MLLNLYYVLTFELNKLTFKLNKLNFKTLSKLVAIYLECYRIDDKKIFTDFDLFVLLSNLKIRDHYNRE